MGLLVDVTRSSYDSELNAFHGVATIVIVNAVGIAEPGVLGPAAEIVAGPGGSNPIIRPVDRPAKPTGEAGGWIGPMFGGTYASGYGLGEAVKAALGIDTGRLAVPIHDRFESPATYDMLSR